MAYGTKFATKNIRGKKVELFVGAEGTFNATVNEQELEAKTVEELIAQISKELTSNFTPISFHRWHDGKLKHGTVTGIHASTKNMIVKWDGEKGSSQESKFYSSAGRFLHLTAVEQEEYTRMQSALEAATKKLEKYEADHAIEIAEEVEKSLKAE
jgi:hypothetical protein